MGAFVEKQRTGTSRHRVRMLALSFLLISGAFAFWLYLHRDQVTHATFDRVEAKRTHQVHHWTSSDDTVSWVVTGQVQVEPWHVRLLNTAKRALRIE